MSALSVRVAVQLPAFGQVAMAQTRTSTGAFIDLEEQAERAARFERFAGEAFDALQSARHEPADAGMSCEPRARARPQSIAQDVMVAGLLAGARRRRGG